MEKNAIEQTSVTKFDVKGKSLYVKVIWKPNENDLFHITIYDGDVTWSGRLSHEFAQKYRERFEENEEQYLKDVKKSFQQSGEGDFVYDFDVKDDVNSAIFTWKKKFEDSQHEIATLIHGSVPVHREDTLETKDLLLDFLLVENIDLRTTIDNLKEKNEGILNDLKKCKTELEKFVDIKTTLETSLYGKFVQLLNAKKRRIQLLEGNIYNFSEPGKDFMGADG
ncbi:uncharacterized protein LOC113498456 [Trichoplusia ni]|uniref:Uncharacterized protein LOC113498456 n=1 Tax=Trichoplusia ni TaxID=7111 RepID=A0A7E5W1U3_TRINI|nr:uncharacterized protein LOC113498456 [Trichoplusia ni]